jgi:type II secretory pathway component PulF
MKLAYKAYDSQGIAQVGVIESADIVAAADTLRRKGLFVAEVTEPAAKVANSRSKLGLKLKAGQRIKDVALFARQLSVLLSSGAQLVEALNALDRQAKSGPWRQAIAGLRSRIEEGASLSKAMEVYPEYFDSVCCSLTAAGESSGHLVEMLDRLATLKQGQLRVRNSVVGALIYPTLLMFVSISVFSLLLLFVIPRFAGLFETLDVPLPGSTKVLLAVSVVFRRYWWALAILLAGAIVSMRAYLRTPDGHRFRDAAVLRLPYMGTIVRSLITARIIRLLGVLTQGHLPVLEALGLVKQSVTNVHYAELIAKAESHVVDGDPLSLAFSNTDLIAPTVYEAIRCGEQSGQLDRLLLDIADFLDSENEVVVRSLTSIIEPVILVSMGIIVGLIAVSMFMPLFDLTSIVGKGGA